MSTRTKALALIFLGLVGLLIMFAQLREDRKSIQEGPKGYRLAPPVSLVAPPELQLIDPDRLDAPVTVDAAYENLLPQVKDDAEWLRDLDTVKARAAGGEDAAAVVETSRALLGDPDRGSVTSFTSRNISATSIEMSVDVEYDNAEGVPQTISYALIYSYDPENESVTLDDISSDLTDVEDSGEDGEFSDGGTEFDAGTAEGTITE